MEIMSELMFGPGGGRVVLDVPLAQWQQFTVSVYLHKGDEAICKLIENNIGMHSLIHFAMENTFMFGIAPSMQ